MALHSFIAVVLFHGLVDHEALRASATPMARAAAGYTPYTQQQFGGKIHDCALRWSLKPNRKPSEEFWRSGHGGIVELCERVLDVNFAALAASLDLSSQHTHTKRPNRHWHKDITFFVFASRHIVPSWWRVEGGSGHK